MVDIELERELTVEKPKPLLHAYLNSDVIATGNSEKTSTSKKEFNFTIKEERSPIKSPIKKDTKPTLDENSLLAQTLLHGAVPNAKTRPSQQNSNLVISSNKENLVKESQKGKVDPLSGKVMMNIIKQGPEGTIPIVLTSTSASQGTSSVQPSMLLRNLIITPGDKKSATQNVGFSFLPAGLKTSKSSSSTASPALPPAVQLVLGNMGSIVATAASPQQLPIPVHTSRPGVKTILQPDVIQTKPSKEVSAPGQTLKDVSVKPTIMLQGVTSGSMSKTVGHLKMITTANNILQSGHVSSVLQSLSSKSPGFQLVGTSASVAQTSISATSSPVVMAVSASQAPGSSSMPPVTSPQTLYVRCKDSQGNIFLVPHHLLKQVAATQAKTCTTVSSSIKSSVSSSSVSPALVNAAKPVGLANTAVLYKPSTTSIMNTTASSVVIGNTAGTKTSVTGSSLTVTTGMMGVISRPSTVLATSTATGVLVPVCAVSQSNVTSKPIVSSVPQTVVHAKTSTLATLLHSQNLPVGKISKPAVSLLKPELMLSGSSPLSVNATHNKDLPQSIKQGVHMDKKSVPIIQTLTGASVNSNLNLKKPSTVLHLSGNAGTNLNSLSFKNKLQGVQSVTDAFKVGGNAVSINKHIQQIALTSSAGVISSTSAILPAQDANVNSHGNSKVRVTTHGLKVIGYDGLNVNHNSSKVSSVSSSKISDNYSLKVIAPDQKTTNNSLNIISPEKKSTGDILMSSPSISLNDNTADVKSSISVEKKMKSLLNGSTFSPGTKNNSLLKTSPTNSVHQITSVETLPSIIGHGASVRGDSNQNTLVGTFGGEKLLIHIPSDNIDGSNMSRTQPASTCSSGRSTPSVFNYKKKKLHETAPIPIIPIPPISRYKKLCLFPSVITT